MRSKKSAKRITPRSKRNEPSTSSTYFSPSTDEDQTDYNLQFANQSIKDTQKSGERRRSDKRANKENQNETRRSSAKNTRNTRSNSEDAADTLDVIGKRNARGQPSTSQRRSNKIDNLRINTTSNKKSVPLPSNVGEQGTQSRSNTIAVREVANNTNPPRSRKLQEPEYNFQIPRAPLYRIIREILFDLAPEHFRITTMALNALQESLEFYLIIFLADAYKCTMHRERKTLSVKDLQLVRYLRGVMDIGNR